MKKFLLALLLLSGVLTAGAQTVTRLIGASPFQDSLWVFDTTNFNVVRRYAPTPSAGGAITGTNGIATDPSTGMIYVVFKQSAVSGRVLGTLDPLTGVVTIVGNLGDNFSSITFNGNNTLLGVTGDGASVPETAYRIDKTNANKTVLVTLGNGADGEVICYNSTDNMVYHWSGNTTIVYEKFDTSGVTVTNIPISGTTNGETFGACYIGNNTFLTSNINSRFQHFLSNGTVTAQIGASSPDDIRGTTLITCSRAITASAATFCDGDSVLLTHGSAGAFGYQWYLDGVLISGATSQTYYATQGGHYNCIVNDACGMDSLGTGTNVVRSTRPTVTVSGSNTTFCAGDSAQLSGTAAVSYQWYNNGIPVAGATTNTYAALVAGNYNMIATNSFGCSDSAAVGVTVVVNPLPVVNLGNDTSSCSSLTLDAGNAGATYLWCDGATTQMNTFNASATCAVMVTNSFGCTSSDTITFVISTTQADVSTSDSLFCPAEPAVTLNLSPAGGTLSGPGISGSSFTPVNAGAGTHTILYTFTDSLGCTTSDSLHMQVFPVVNVSLTSSDNNVCADDASVALTGSPAGGVYSGPGVSGSSFDPSTAGTGTQTITYTYQDANGCFFATTDVITVNACVGIAEQTPENTFSLFPNPATEKVQLQIGQASTVSIVNSLGETVFAAQLENGIHTIDVSAFAAGVYVVRVQQDAAVYAQQLLIAR